VCERQYNERAIQIRAASPHFDNEVAATTQQLGQREKSMKASRGHIAMLSAQSAGHVYPMLGLCSELTDRGYRVTYPAVKTFADHIRQNGAEPLIFAEPTLTNAEKIWTLPIENDLRSWQLYAALLSSITFSYAAATVVETQDFYRANPPDLIVYDWHAFAGRILARMFGCRAVHAYSHFAHNDFLIRENGVYQNPFPMLGHAHLVDSFLAAYGIESTDNLWHREDLTIILVPDQFQFDLDCFDSRFHFVGPCLNRQSRSTWKDESGGRKILLISESTVTTGRSSFFRVCAEAFADSDYYIVFSAGTKTHQIERREIPANFEINRNCYNIDILPHAAAVVCASGMGIVLESLSFGVPVLAVPNHAFNSEVAYRVAELGLGIHLRSADVSSNSIRTCVDEIIGDTAMHERVREMQRVIRSSGGARLATDLIEGVVRM